MEVLFLLIGLDVIIGLCNGYIHKDLNSRFGLIGIMKHSVVVLLVLTFKVISDLYNMGDYYLLFKVFYIIQYTLSILENAYSLGIPIPKILVYRLKDYQEKEELEKWEK